MANIVANDAWLLELSDEARALFNTGHELRLYKNNFSPTSASVIGDFTEADFAGYAAVSASGKFGASSQVASGLYKTVSDPFLFTCSSGSQTVYGWYLTDGSDVKLTGNYLAGFTISPGNPLAVVIDYRTDAEYTT